MLYHSQSCIHFATIINKNSCKICHMGLLTITGKKSSYQKQSFPLMSLLSELGSADKQGGAKLFWMNTLMSLKPESSHVIFRVMGYFFPIFSSVSLRSFAIFLSFPWKAIGISSYRFSSRLGLLQSTCRDSQTIQMWTIGVIYFNNFLNILQGHYLECFAVNI